MTRLSLAIALLLLAACQQTDTPQPASAEAAATAAPAPFAFEEASIASLQEQMASGSLTSRALAQAYLDRIAAIDDAGPRPNAVIEANPDALKEAALRDVERVEGSGLLHDDGR